LPLSAVDINCDMGEGFGRWTLGDADDDALMRLISSANIATGFHAGDPSLMNETVRLAVANGIGIGAHPGYRDLQGFGRRRIDGGDAEIVHDIVYQVGSLREFCRRHGAPFQHVKLHGALYMELSGNAAFSKAYVETLRATAPDAFVFCMGMSETYRAAVAAGQPVVREFYADRDYDRSGSIVFRRQIGALDPRRVADKIVRACVEGRVRTVEGDDIDIEFESICFHSDSPGSLGMAEAMRGALLQEGVRIAPVSEIVARAPRAEEGVK